MPHQCVRCNTFYEDKSPEIIRGCTCGGRLFFYIKKEKLEKLRNHTPIENLSSTDKIKIEKDVMDIIGSEENDDAVVLDIEAIRVNKPGSYEIDLVSLFNKEPLVIKLADGKYVVDIVRSFEQLQKKKTNSR
jgi:uncharacterized protein